ncbi:MAG: hypothetical protein WAO81_04180 [Methanosarcina flavescens]
MRRAPDLILSPLEILIALKNLFALEPAYASFLFLKLLQQLGRSGYILSKLYTNHLPPDRNKSNIRKLPKEIINTPERANKA